MGKQEWVAGQMGGQGVVGGCEDGQARCEDGQARCENRSGWQVLLANEGAREASASQTGNALVSRMREVSQRKGQHGQRCHDPGGHHERGGGQL